MARDPLAEARRWIHQARADVGDARVLAEHGSAATACFLAQQAAEKALTGMLYASGSDMVLGHSVAALCEAVAERFPASAPDCRRWASLDQYYIPTRYPDALPGGIPADVYTPAQAGEAIATATEVLAFADRAAAG